ncbi:glutamate carboxypeptidase 2-like [Ylistrum balloti]|uniref:glutamate carboxypeptidase 2-like n=1 Tax=Ylistrum balloti TaxID=509963 RepID=UPI002905AA13|nr:glutamate carboxypeptidase 2-like [Ylistrum balloti]
MPEYRSEPGVSLTYINKNFLRKSDVPELGNVMQDLRAKYSQLLDNTQKLLRELDKKYITIWAEEKGGLVRGKYEYSFGDGVTGKKAGYTVLAPTKVLKIGMSVTTPESSPEEAGVVLVVNGRKTRCKILKAQGEFNHVSDVEGIRLNCRSGDHVITKGHSRIELAIQTRHLTGIPLWKNSNTMQMTHRYTRLRSKAEDEEEGHEDRKGQQIEPEMTSANLNHIHSVHDLLAGRERFSNLSINTMDSNKKKTIRSRLIFGAVLVGVVGLAVGFGIGYAARGSSPEQAHVNGDSSTQETQTQNAVNMLLTSLNSANIKANLRLYTSRPRMSGTAGGDEIVDIIAKEWRDSGLDMVRVTPYDVLMSYPNRTNPNTVQLLTQTDEVLFEAATFEAALDAEGNNSEVVPPFNAFAVAGVAEGDLVYVNYGRIEDFVYLRDNKSLSVEGKIVIARYGKIFRGDKVKIAQQFNATGIIMYTDPADFNMGNTTYPDSWWLPGTGVQRGTTGPDGDMLTMFYPAKDYTYRIPKSESWIGNSKIPAQPIGYGDAQQFLGGMKGEEVPMAWRGKLPITYRFGPGFRNSSVKARLTVNNYEEVKTVRNVIGYIRGEIEPDRYVMLGNHHDSWVFGAIDPLSGSAALTEIIRVLGNMLKQGLRPRRTIVFGSWGAEEHGLIGSTEWVEEYMKVLYERTIAYLNVDYACDYPYTLVAGASPLLQDSLYLSAKQVPNPEKNSQFKTLYDAWVDRLPNTAGTEPSVYYSLGSGSDMATFYQRAGVPSVDMWFTYDDDRWDILSYPTYHSAYETFEMFTKFIDPNFNYTLAMSQMWAIMAWDLSNVEKLPFDATRYATAIQNFVDSLKKDFGSVWQEQDVNIEALQSAVNNLTASTNAFKIKIDSLPKDASPLTIRMLNDKMIQFERAFIDPEGLPDRRIYKHVMFAPSLYDSYSDNSFPGVVDTMHDIQINKRADKWNLLKQQVSVATYTIQSAANTLDDVGL